MAAKGEVDLIIRAKNEATKNLDSINKSLKSLADQQTIAGDSAGAADAKFARLGLELARLRTNAQNLQALGNIGEVVTKAAAAMDRQRAAAAEASGELARLTTRQAEVGGRATQMAAAVKTASEELKLQDAALKAAKSSLSSVSKEATTLASQEKALQTSIASAATALAKKQAALDAAARKQAELTAAIAASNGATKAQQNSLDAANRTLERRRAALADTVAKEAELKARLDANRAAQEANAAALQRATTALTEQGVKSAAAKANLAGLKAQADSLATASRALAADVAAAAAASAKQTTALNASEVEMAQVRAAATAARAALAGSTAGTNDAAAAAGKAAVQVAIFAARLAALSGASGRTSVPLGINPEAVRAAKGAVAELGVTIRLASNEATKASVSAAELTAAMKGIGQAKTALQGIGQAITAQKSAVDGAKAAWTAAEAEVKRLALAIKAAGQPSQELATAFGKSQGAARMAKDEFLRQSQAATALANSLKSAGLGSGSLSSAEAALAPNLARVNSLLNQGQTAANAMAAAARAAGNGANDATPKVNGLARALGAMVAAANRAASATNPLNRFKTELLGVVAAGAGLYGIKTQLESVWEAGVKIAANTIRFNVAFDGAEEGAKQLQFARDVALNLKLPIDTLVRSYADLALAAKGSALEGEGARKIFIGFAQAARVNGATTEATNGVFKALTQILSKGKVQAEELRHQLGDRLPGAMQLMATGLGVTTAELDAMMKKGELTSDTLVNMAAVASQRVAPQLAASLDSPAAKLADFQNRIVLFKETIAQSGFLEAVGDAFDKLAKALSTPEAIQAAQDLGVALGEIVTWATTLATSGALDTILAWAKGLGIAFVALQITSIITGLYGFATAIGVTAAAVFGLDVAMAPVLIGLGAIAAVVATVVGAFGLWKLAEWTYNNVPAFAEGMLSIKNAALSAWDGIMQMWELTAAKLTNSFSKVTANLANIWYGMLDKILNSFPELTASLGMGDFGADIAKRAAEAAANLENNEKTLNSTLDEIRGRYAGKERERQQQLQDDIAGYYKDRIAAEAAETPKPAPVAGPVNTAGTETITAGTYVADTTKADLAAAERAAKKRVQLEQSVADQMLGIRAQLEKKSAETVDEQMAAVPAKYAKLYGQLTALGKDRNSEEWKTVDALVAQEQANIKSLAAKKAATAAAKEERAATKAETDSRKQAMEQVNTLLQTRKNIQEQIKQAEASGDVIAVEALKANLVTVTQQANDAIAGMLAFWQSVGGPEADAAIAKLNTMKLTLTKVKEEGILTGNNIGKALGKNLMSATDNFIDRIAETGDVFGSLKEAFLGFARSFLIEIAKMIMQQLLFNAVKAGLSAIGGGGAIGAGVAGAMGAASNHSGGVVGRDSGPTKMLPMSVVQNAVRYHGGGVAGLKSNEIPTVLEAGEVVRTEQQEKALADRMAAGGSGGSAAPAQTTNIINTIDTESFYQAANNSPAFQKTLLNLIRANKSSVKSIIG